MSNPREIQSDTRELSKPGEHDRTPVTTKHENSREVRDNEGRRWRASPQYGNGASKEARKQVGAGRRRNREVTPPSGEFVRKNL